jgi:N-acyl-L-homoserine lactone synthetase
MGNTANYFPSNILAKIHHFRGIETDRLGWRNGIHYTEIGGTDIFSEADNCDTPGTVYFVQRFTDGDIACVVRVHPSIDLYGRDISMIGNNLPHLVDHEDGLPLAYDFFETSRVIVNSGRMPMHLQNGDKNADPNRRKAAHNCLAASILYSASKGIKGFFCFMPVKIWDIAYKAMGMDIIPLGGPKEMRDKPDGIPYPVYAGMMHFTPDSLERVRQNTGFTEDKLTYGIPPEERMRQFANELGHTDKESVEQIIQRMGKDSSFTRSPGASSTFSKIPRSP